jgi:hypothetical protein
MTLGLIGHSQDTAVFRPRCPHPLSLPIRVKKRRNVLSTSPHYPQFRRYAT